MTFASFTRALRLLKLLVNPGHSLKRLTALLDSGLLPVLLKSRIEDISSDRIQTLLQILAREQLFDEVDAAVVHHLKTMIVQDKGQLLDYQQLAQPDTKYLIRQLVRGLVLHRKLWRGATDVLVDFDLPHLKQMDEASFDWEERVDDNLIRKVPTEHCFPMPRGQIQLRVVLVEPEGSRGTEDILAKMDYLSVRPTLSPEVLALVSKEPNLQRADPIVSLGSVWVGSGGRRYVLYLYEYLGRRRAALKSYETLWYPYCRFSAVTKELSNP